MKFSKLFIRQSNWSNDKSALKARLPRPGHGHEMRRALLEILGQEKYDYLSDQFLGYFFTREDTKFLASLGLNYVRIPINHTMRKTSDQRKWLQAGWSGRRGSPSTCTPFPEVRTKAGTLILESAKHCSGSKKIYRTKAWRCGLRLPNATPEMLGCDRTIFPISPCINRDRKIQSHERASRFRTRLPPNPVYKCWNRRFVRLISIKFCSLTAIATPWISARRGRVGALDLRWGCSDISKTQSHQGDLLGKNITLVGSQLIKQLEIRR